MAKSWREWLDSEGLCEGTHGAPEATALPLPYTCGKCQRQFRYPQLAWSGRARYLPKHRPLRV